MESLPLELLHLVFRKLEAGEIPRQRLVCRKFAEIGLHYLQVSGRFYLRKHSLERLEKIANHPVLSRNILDLVFFVDVLPVFTDKVTWLQQAYAICHTQPDDDDDLCLAWLRRYTLNKAVPLTQSIMPEIFIEAAWTEHEAIRQEQNELLDDLEANFIRVFRLNLQKLLYLRSICLETLSRSYCRSMRPLYTLRPAVTSWYSCNRTCSLSSFETVCPKMLAMILGLKQTTNSLRSLHIGITGLIGLSECSTNNLLLKPSCLQNISGLSLLSASSSSRLHRRTYPYSVRSQFDGRDNTQFIQSLLFNAPRLEIIHLRIDAEPRLNTKSIFQNCIWNNLHKLAIGWMSIEKSSFESFLSVHARTLHTLLLSNSELVSSSLGWNVWISFFIFIQQSMNLRQFDVYGCLIENRWLEFDVNRTCNLNEERQDVPIHRMIRYLVCGQAYDTNGIPDSFVQTLMNWHALSWADIEEAYD